MKLSSQVRLRTIKSRIAEINFPCSAILSGIKKLPDEDQEAAISLLEKLGILPTQH